MNTGTNPHYRIRRFATRQGARLLSLVGSRNYQRYVILSRSRSGSNLLLTLLKSHPNIRCDTEIFARLDGRDPREILKQTFARMPFYVLAKGFKLFYYHPLDTQSEELWRQLYAMPDLKIIHLKRRNMLDTLVSRELAEISQKWWQKDQDETRSRGPEPQLELPVDKVKTSFETTAAWQTEAEKNFANHDCLTVYYEDLVKHRDAVFKEITDFLGVKFVPPETNLVKQNRRKKNQVIKNFDELKNAFQGSRWASFFAEE